MERLVKFEVLGQEFPLYTDAPEEDVQEILHLVKTQLEEASQGGGSRGLPANKAAILTSLNMASQYVRLKREFAEYRQLVESSFARLADRIEETAVATE
ncbi:cell division protein ZapA [Desulfurivibrio dismutans]|uniref:cell division protein ZapA n=1 Tax=Desulfurivibrio dismutans TaxID=1398908 RepID=UPI0023DB3425|nr:cell division protein ZapA [Desulfurivibrio alkaliphilus]MDF1615544.1 cell division protein ZapA [Desulfurivibrio alkaliphilus]